MSSTRKAPGLVARAYHFVIRSVSWMAVFALCLLIFSGSLKLQILVLIGFGGLFYWRVGRHLVRFMWAPQTNVVAEPKAEDGKQQASAITQTAPPAEPAKKRNYAKSIVVVPASVTPALSAQQPARVVASPAQPRTAFAGNTPAVVLPFSRKS
jgi:hypothetical protein